MEVWINLEPMASSEIRSGFTLTLLEIWCKNYKNCKNYITRNWKLQKTQWKWKKCWKSKIKELLQLSSGRLLTKCSTYFSWTSKIWTLPAPILDEEKKLSQIFIFTLLCGTTKKCKNKNLTYFFFQYNFQKCTGREGLSLKGPFFIFYYFFFRNYA